MKDESRSLLRLKRSISFTVDRLEDGRWAIMGDRDTLIKAPEDETIMRPMIGRGDTCNEALREFLREYIECGILDDEKKS